MHLAAFHWIRHIAEIALHGLLIRYVKLRVTHASGAPGTFSPLPTSKETASKRSRHASRHVRHARAVMHVGLANPRGRGKGSLDSRRMRNQQSCISSKRPMIQWHVRNPIDVCINSSSFLKESALLDIGHRPQCSCKDLTDILISETCPGDAYMDLKQTEFLNSSRLGIEQFSCRLSVDDGDISLRWINGDTVLYNYMVSNSNYFSHQRISIANRCAVEK